MMISKQQTTNNRRLKKGVSLIELIIYIALVAIVLVAVTDLASRLVFAQVKVAKTSDVSQNLNFALAKLTSDIENASAISGSYPADTLNITVDSHQLIYTLTDGVLYLSKDALDPVAITSNSVQVEALPGNNLFSKIINGAAESVDIMIKVSQSTDMTNSQTAQTTIFMKGKE